MGKQDLFGVGAQHHGSCSERSSTPRAIVTGEAAERHDAAGLQTIRVSGRANIEEPVVSLKVLHARPRANEAHLIACLTGFVTALQVNHINLQVEIPTAHLRQISLTSMTMVHMIPEKLIILRIML